MSPPDNQFYPWLVGMRRAMEMMLTGDSISGIEAVSYTHLTLPTSDLV